MPDSIAPLGVNAALASPKKEISAQQDAQLRQSAKDFEKAFIAQMLKYSGLDKAISAQSGANGSAFSSFLVDEYASELVEQGGFGLTEQIYQQLKDRA